MRLRARSLPLLSGLTIRRSCELWCRLQRWLRSQVAMTVVSAGSYSSDSTLSLGTSMCHWCGPKKTTTTTTKNYRYIVPSKYIYPDFSRFHCKNSLYRNSHFFLSPSQVCTHTHTHTHTHICTLL